jgi:hypothetical protein
MKVLDAPHRPHHLREEFTRHSRVQDAIRLCVNAKRNGGKRPDLHQMGLTRAQRTFIGVMAKKELCDPELQRIYIETIDATAQLFRRPEITDLEFDTHALLDQPELKRALATWILERKSSGPEANPACAKALMLNVALGSSSHVRTARKTFETQRELQEVFAHHEREQAAIADREPKPCTIRDYTSCLDQIRDLCATGFDRRLLEANIEILKALRHMYPKAGVCELAGIDGTDVAAWCMQVGVRDFDEEQLIRTRTPKAGPRYIPGNNEVVATDGETVEIAGKGTFWRGYYLVVLVDVKTGLPIVWTLRNGDWKEADALKELLFLLYKLWPDCPLKVVIGDKAWDFAEYAKLCAFNYGIQLVAIQKDSNRDKERILDIKEHKHVSGYRGDGTVICRTHGIEMTFIGVEGITNRDGLEPGEDNVEANCKARYRCDACGSVRALPMRLDWNIFTYHPHNAVGTAGMRKRHAERRALELRRNITESTFGSLKTICQLALQGPRRTRLTDFDTVSTLIALSFTARNSLALAGERIRAGEYPTTFPANLLGGRKMGSRA